MTFDPSNVGKTARIVAVSFDNHRSRVGMQGVITRAVKCRTAYQMTLDDGTKWEASADNVEVQEQS